MIYFMLIPNDIGWLKFELLVDFLMCHSNYQHASDSRPLLFTFIPSSIVSVMQGSLQSVMAMLLQLNKAELKLPRRVYQRGYRDWNCLVEEVIADTYITLAAQLPKVIVTSLGPMHEVTRFGEW